MQKLAEICISRPVFAAMIILSLVVVGAAAQDSSAQPQNNPKQETEDRDVIIEFTPDPEMPSEIVTDIELRVTLLATFKKNGKVTDVKRFSSQVPDFIPGPVLEKLESATMDAARKIQFIPAIRNGRRITQRALLEFTFKREKKKKYFDWRSRQIA